MQTDRGMITSTVAGRLDRAGPAWGLVPRLLLLLTIALVAQTPWGTARSEPASPVAATAADRAVTAVRVLPSAVERKAFHETMLKVPVPHRGCFVAHYPAPTWTETACVAAPRTPSPRHFGALPNTVGDGNDFFSNVSGLLTSATGSFDSATGVVTEYGTEGNDLTTVHPDVYELQLNSNVYTAPCPAAGGCSGWEQFLFSQSQCATACIFVEYWLLNYPPPCPPGAPWIYYAGTPTTTPGCFFNTTPTLVPVQPLADLGSLRLSATVTGGNDVVTVSVAGGDVYTQSDPSVADLGTGWNGAEFNVFGDCCAGNIYFTGAPATLVVRQATSSVPTCTSFFTGTTAETNNLNLVGPCTASGGAAPAIVFTESGGGSLPPGVSIGDPHFTTFQAAHYNFMEAGEYILVQSDPDLTVQSRQALISPPGAPAIAQNVAMAVKIGTNQISVYPTSLEVNGTAVQLADTHAISLPGGVLFARAGNLYTISRANGDIIQGRQIAASSSFPAHVDITVNLGGGTNPAKVHGLLVSAPTPGGPVILRTGVAIKAPLVAADLHTFAERWRIEPVESLFHAEGRPQISGLIKPLTVADLDQKKALAARQVCVAAGVTGDASLDDCTLDVAASGDKAAADAFVYQTKPAVVVRAK